MASLTATQQVEAQLIFQEQVELLLEAANPLTERIYYRTDQGPCVYMSRLLFRIGDLPPEQRDLAVLLMYAGE